MERVKVKICGITTVVDALVAAEAGADALGFVFWQNSPRYVEPEEAGRITTELPPFVKTVGVFVNEAPENIREIITQAGVDCVQLHGEEGPEDAEEVKRATGAPVIKAIRMGGQAQLKRLCAYRVSALLLDAYRKGVPGGTGETFDWDLAVQAEGAGRIILSGGLNPENVAAAIGRVAPYAVDVSSGVESTPGRKDEEKIKRFMEEVRKAARV
ncbi:MAG: phosphoribosylanthranilate isomerase [Thermodesulfobacteriota bacterium]